MTRPAYHHALLMADAEFLRLTLREGMRLGIDAASLVHALQNHDELTYELVHFTDTHAQDLYTFRGRSITGGELADTVRADLLATLTGPDRPVQPALHHQRHRVHDHHASPPPRSASPTSTR